MRKKYSDNGTKMGGIVTVSGLEGTLWTVVKKKNRLFHGLPLNCKTVILKSTAQLVFQTALWYYAIPIQMLSTGTFTFRTFE